MNAQTYYYRGIPTPQKAEEHGLLAAIMWLQELQLQRVTIEFDYKTIVEGVRRRCNIVTEYDSILSVCNYLISRLWLVSSGGKLTL